MPRIGEFELIERLAKQLGEAAPDPAVLIGIGDDAAVVRRGVLADIYTTDTLVDGVHFMAGRIPWADLGWKSLAVNLSDVAAMGGRPLYSLVTLGVTAGTRPKDLAEVYRGLRAASEEFGGRVIGGDVVRSPVMFITVAMVGTATKVSGRPAVLSRSAVRPGDQIAVTGVLGSSAGGLRVIAEGRVKGRRPTAALVRVHNRPVPRVAEGRALVRAGVRAAMDVSDGLIADLGKLCAASNVRAVVSAERVPVADELKRAFPNDFLQLALGGGEDYELLFAAPPDVMRRACANVGPSRPTVIGRAIAPRGRRARPGAKPGARLTGPPGAVRVVDREGQEVAVASAGWDHLVG
jgi:thiamine-monophosphate kinase